MSSSVSPAASSVRSASHAPTLPLATCRETGSSLKTEVGGAGAPSRGGAGLISMRLSPAPSSSSPPPPPFLLLALRLGLGLTSSTDAFVSAIEYFGIFAQTAEKTLSVGAAPSSTQHQRGFHEVEWILPDWGGARRSRSERREKLRRGVFGRVVARYRYRQ